MTLVDFAAHGNIYELETLIEKGYDVNQADEDGVTPAYIAVQEGQTRALEILVEAGCDVNQADKDGSTPAYIAAQIGQTVALELLVNPAGYDSGTQHPNSESVFLKSDPLAGSRPSSRHVGHPRLPRRAVV
jgi:ankyrin repeat protein